MSPRLRVLAIAAFISAAVAVLLLAAPTATATYTTAGGQGDVSLDLIDAATADVAKVSDSPLVYSVLDNITISAGDRLVIAAGTRIEFQPFTSLAVAGNLSAVGDAASPVEFALAPGGFDAWAGIDMAGPSAPRLEHVRLIDSLGLSYSNGSRAVLRDVAYTGRLLLDNVSGIVLERLTMTATDFDPGRPALWIVNSDNVTVRGGDFSPKAGWGVQDSILVFLSRDVRLIDVAAHIDAFQVNATHIFASQRVYYQNFTLTPGPNSGNPGAVLSATEATEVWFEGIHVLATPALAAIYGLNANVTIANSTFPSGLTPGPWQNGGTLVGVNATNLPAYPSFGGEIWEYELVRVRAYWGYGGPVATAFVTIENASHNASGGISDGSSPWLWALRTINGSAGLQDFSSYTATLACNCTASPVNFTVSDGPGIDVVMAALDEAAPTVSISVGVARTGEPGTLSAAGSLDNDAIAALSWSAVSVDVRGLPCSTPICVVTFYTPGSFTVFLNVTDKSGNMAARSVRLTIADATPPEVGILAVEPARPGQDAPFTVTATVTDNDPAFLPTVEWYVDGARVAADNLTPTFSLPAIGNHTIKVVVRDDTGNAGNASTVVYVRDSKPPEIGTWTPPSGLRAGARVTLNGSVARDNVGVVSWRWAVTGPGTNYTLTTESPSATFPSAGTYNITLRVEDGEANVAARSFTVVVEPAESGAGFLPAAGGATLLASLVLALVLVSRRRR